MTEQHSSGGDRLNKYLALQLGISRREADNYIAGGKVAVNGTIAALGARINPSDSIMVGGKPIAATAELQYLMLNKPIGYVSSRRPQGQLPTIYELLPPKYHVLKPVGRLDQNSSGLLLLTNDGDFAYRMTHPKFIKTKIYYVQLDHPLEPLHQQMISDYGIQLEDGKSKFIIEKLDESLDASFSEDSAFPAERGKTNDQMAPSVNSASGTVQGNLPMQTGLQSRSSGPAERGSEGKDGGEAATIYRVTMSEGRNRQIRRTFKALGYTVTYLHRIQFGPFALGDLAPGAYQLISANGA